MPIPDDVTLTVPFNTKMAESKEAITVNIGRNREYDQAGLNPAPDDYVWFYQSEKGVKYAPEDAEKIATMLMYEAKLARENNNRQKENS